MWSINRDSQCGSPFPETGMLSNTCSGTPQSAWQFTPDLRPAAGHRAGRVGRRRRAARGGGHQPGRRPLPAVVGRARTTRSATRSSRTARSTRPSGTTAATTRRRRCSTPTRRPGNCSARWCPATTRRPSPRCPPAPTRPGRQDTQYQVGNKVLYQGLPYQAKWVNQGVSPATRVHRPLRLPSPPPRPNLSPTPSTPIGDVAGVADRAPLHVAGVADRPAAPPIRSLPRTAQM